jgi:hypothetical protein
MMASFRTKDSRGFGVLPLLVLMVVLSVLSLSFLRFRAQTNRSLATTRAQSDRDEMLITLESAVFHPANLERSIAENAGSAFARCLAPGGGSDCVAAVGGSPAIHEFRAVDVMAAPLAGTSASPARYTADGAPCAGPASQFCPFEAIAFFTPVCAGGSADCDRAERLELGVTLRLSNAIDKLRATNFRLRRATTEPLRPRPVDEILSRGARSCAGNAYVAGIDGDLYPICRPFAAAPGGVVSGLDAAGSGSRTGMRSYRCLVAGGTYQDTFQSQQSNCEGWASQGNLYDAFIPN